MRNLQSVLVRDGDVLQVVNPVPWIARAFGTPFLLVGLWFVRVVAETARDIVTGVGGPGEMMPALLIGVVMSMTFLIPGVILCFGRRRLFLDHQSVSDKVTFMGVGRTVRSPLGIFKTVRVALRIKRNRGARDSMTYDVEMVKEDGDKLLVALATSASTAIVLGKEVATFLRLPLQDRTDADPNDDDAS